MSQPLLVQTVNRCRLHISQRKLQHLPIGPTCQLPDMYLVTHLFLAPVLWSNLAWQWATTMTTPSFQVHREQSDGYFACSLPGEGTKSSNTWLCRLDLRLDPAPWETHCIILRCGTQSVIQVSHKLNKGWSGQDLIYKIVHENSPVHSLLFNAKQRR